jgi:hypothetical protein
MARYKETKERYQQMVNAITRNIEGVFMHGGKMAGAGQFGAGHYMADGGVTPLSGLIISFPDGRERNANKIINIITDYVDNNYEDYGDEIYVRVMDNQRGEVTEYDLQQIAKDVRSLNLGVTVESYAKGGHMAKGGYFAYPSGDGGDELGVFYDKQSMINFAVANKDKYGKLIFEGIEDGDILEVNKDDSKDVITWLFSRIGMNTKEANKKIKMWFISNYPEEEEQIDERVTFDDIWFDLKNQRNIYYALGNRFVIREVFEKIATIYGVEYDFIEKMYKRESYAKGGMTNIKGTTEPKAYPEAEPNTNVVV